MMMVSRVPSVARSLSHLKVTSISEIGIVQVNPNATTFFRHMARFKAATFPALPAANFKVIQAD